MSYFSDAFSCRCVQVVSTINGPYVPCTGANIFEDVVSMWRATCCLTIDNRQWDNCVQFPVLADVDTINWELSCHISSAAGIKDES